MTPAILDSLSQKNEAGAAHVPANDETAIEYRTEFNGRFHALVPHQANRQVPRQLAAYGPNDNDKITTDPTRRITLTKAKGLTEPVPTKTL
jgi:hypothetical protein